MHIQNEVSNLTLFTNYEKKTRALFTNIEILLGIFSSLFITDIFSEHCFPKVKLIKKN